MDSLHRHPNRAKVMALRDKLDRVREQEKVLIKELAQAERDARDACSTQCSVEDKWTRDSYPYAELYCRLCGTYKR